MAESELHALEDALEADDPVRITEAIADVVEALSSSRRRRVAVESLASKVSDATDPQSDASRAARSYLTASSKANQTGLGVLTTVFGYVDGEASASETLDVVERATEEHAAVATAESTLREEKGAIDLPSLLTLTPPDDVELPKGSTKSVEATVENLGGAPTTSVTASADSDLDVAVSPSELGTVEADEVTTLTLTASGDTAGSYDVALEVTGEEDEASATASVVVVDAETYLEQGRSLLVQMREQVDSLSSDETGGGNGNGKSGNGGGNGGLNGLSNKLDATIDKTGDVQDAIERGRIGETAIDNRIGALVGDVQAIRKQIDALRGNHLPDEAAGALRYNAGQVTSNFELAKTADL